MKILALEQNRISDLVKFLSLHAPDHPEIASTLKIEWQKANGFLAVRGDQIIGYVAMAGSRDDTAMQKTSDGLLLWFWIVRITKGKRQGDYYSANVRTVR
jgi:hypothetical protein